jgi:hypothetical protein
MVVSGRRMTISEHYLEDRADRTGTGTEVISSDSMGEGQGIGSPLGYCRSDMVISLGCRARQYRLCGLGARLKPAVPLCGRISDIIGRVATALGSRLASRASHAGHAYAYLVRTASVRRLEGIVVRRSPHPWPGRRSLLHQAQNNHDKMADRSASRRRVRDANDELAGCSRGPWRVHPFCRGCLSTERRCAQPIPAEPARIFSALFAASITVLAVHASPGFESERTS